MFHCRFEGMRRVSFVRDVNNALEIGRLRRRRVCLSVVKPQAWWSTRQTARALPEGISCQDLVAALRWQHLVLGVFQSLYPMVPNVDRRGQ